MSDGSRTVLVVEDDLDVRPMLKKLLERDGFEVFEAADVAEGLAQVRARRFSLALLDKNLPDGSGEAVATLARQLDEDVCIAMLTAYASRDSALAMHGVIDLYLSKPFRTGELIAALTVAIERRKALRSSRAAPTPCKRVLVVEINEGARNACSVALSDLGFEVVHGYWRGGLAELRAEPRPDAMVLAVEGCVLGVRIEVMKAQTQRPDFQVVLLTEHDELEAAIESLALRAERVGRHSSVDQLRSTFQRVFGDARAS